MHERTIDILTAIVLGTLSLVMLGQLEGVPREGVLFPQCILYLILGCSVLLAGKGMLKKGGTISFFAGIPPVRWCLVCALFLALVLGAMYLSFTLSMALGLFAMLCVLAPRKTARSLIANAAFTLALIAFFHIFFTKLMHIYFPETLF